MFLFCHCNINLSGSKPTVIEKSRSSEKSEFMENKIFQRGKISKDYLEVKIDQKTENGTDDNIPVIICGISLQARLLIGQ